MTNTFIQLSKRNTLDSNLTELNATDAADGGFLEHTDWAGHVVRYGYAMKTITKTKAKSVLDVGCGRFPFLNYAWKNRATEEYTYTGLDLRAKEAWFEKLGWKKGDVTLIQCDLVLDEIPVTSSDVVICTEVYEHIGGGMQQELVNRLFKWTNPGGFCLFSTPNAGVSDSTAENHKDADGVSRERTYDEKIAAVQLAGFEVVKTFGVFIAKRRIPQSYWTAGTQLSESFLTNAMHSVLAAPAFPRESNNALFVLRRPIPI
jgi:2-polyprenyl-3-methyl-5-hydroxy-6-metoxy-1,4-benzoquinol methylase